MLPFIPKSYVFISNWFILSSRATFKGVRSHSNCIIMGKNTDTENSMTNGKGLEESQSQSSIKKEATISTAQEITKNTNEVTNSISREPNFTTIIKGKCNRLLKTSWEEKFQETEYYFENGLRKVYPYMFTYTTFIKGRWIGRPLLEVFAAEFMAHSQELYLECVKNGRLKVNDEKVDPDYVLQNNDILSSTLHRHELPVLAAPIKIIYNSDGLLVIDKPPSVPVHACGRYRSNSIVFILGKELGFKNLHVMHRLDRLTSGILMFGLNMERTREIEEQIRARTISKEYLCRVEGNFPDKLVECEEPIARMCHKIGLSMVDSDGKLCKTQFKKLSYNGKSSVVLCKPLTGRTHQIRVHLQYLGYPIVNDPNYNHPSFGPSRGKGGEFGKPKEEIIQDIIKEHTKESWKLPENYVADDILSHEDYDVALKSLKHYTDGEDFKILLEKYKFDKDKLSRVTNCTDCMFNFRDPKVSELVMFLHAWRYKGEGFDFQSSVPVWAKEEWTFS